VPAHALAWAGGLVVALIGMDVVSASESLAVQLIDGAAVGLAMGAVAAAGTGPALVRLVVPQTGPRTRRAR
jgi:hypothetical protein